MHHRHRSYVKTPDFNVSMGIIEAVSFTEPILIIILSVVPTTPINISFYKANSTIINKAHPPIQAMSDPVCQSIAPSNSGK